MRSRLRVLFLLVAVVVAVAAATAMPAAATSRDDYSAAILRLIAGARAERGLPAVHTKAALSRAALEHSRDMLRREYFSHTSPGGDGCMDRSRRGGYRFTGYRSGAVGEVIAWGVGLRGTPQEVFEGWMGSPPHRAVIFSSRWRDVGVACVEGTFSGMSGSFMYTVDFGRRSH